MKTVMAKLLQLLIQLLGTTVVQDMIHNLLTYLAAKTATKLDDELVEALDKWMRGAAANELAKAAANTSPCATKGRRGS